MPRTADPLRSKALGCLRSGRVTVLRVRLDDNWRPVGVVARVRSSRGRGFYRVQFRTGSWSCTCVAAKRDDPCPHVAAVALVTTAATR